MPAKADKDDNAVPLHFWTIGMVATPVLSMMIECAALTTVPPVGRCPMTLQ